MIKLLLFIYLCSLIFGSVGAIFSFMKDVHKFNVEREKYCKQKMKKVVEEKNETAAGVEEEADVQEEGETE